MLSVLQLNYDKIPFKERITLLNSQLNLGALRSPSPDTLQGIILKIKVFLEDKCFWYEGLLLLHALLSQCSSDLVFEENAYYWTKALLRTLQGSDCVASKELTFAILKMIITCSANFSGLRQAIGEELLPNILAALLKTEDEDQWIIPAIDCLSVCMKEMPTFCSPFKEEIEKFLEDHFEISLYSETDPVSECYCHLPKLERSSSSSVQSLYRKRWIEQVEKLIGSLHSIISSIYGDLCTEKNRVSPLVLLLPPEREDPLSSLLCKSRHFQIVSKILSKMLCCETEVSVDVPVKHILIVVDRVLNVTYGNLKSINNKQHRLHLATVIPMIHTSALNILEALILCGGEYFLAEESSIGSLLLKTFKAHYSSTNDFCEPIHCSLMRSTTYRVMRVWLEKLCPFSLENCAEELCEELLKDIKPFAKLPFMKDLKVMSICRATGNLGSVSKGKPKACTNISTCTEALHLLSSLTCASYRLMKEESFRYIQKTVTDILISMQQNQRQNNVPPMPYNDDACRLELYRLFLKIVINSRLENSTPLCAAMTIFRDGQRDNYIEISQFCFEASTICFSIVQPERIVQVKTVSKPLEVQVDNSNMHINIAYVQSTPASEWDATHSAAVNNAGASQENSPGSSPKRAVDQKVPFAVPREKDVQKMGKEKANDILYDVVDDYDEEEEMEDEEYDEGEEEEDEYEEQIPEDDYEDPQDEDIAESSAEIVDGATASSNPESKDDNINSPIGVINENGFDTSDNSRGSVPEVDEEEDDNNDEDDSGIPVKRRRTTSTESVTDPSPSTKLASTSATECRGEPESEATVEVMMNDFVESSPDRVNS